MKYHLTITEPALRYIQKMISKEGGIALRLTIKKTGCSGFSYLPQIVQEINAQDIAVVFDQVKILMDPAWTTLLNGVTIDYVEEEKSGLKQKRLIFINPNETSRCGCGESFHVE